MSPFHPFYRLPIELRIRIWNLTAFPRIVHVRRQWRKRWVTVGELQVQYMATSTPCPPVMQVCHESRQHAPYQRAYTNGFEPRYIWVNFEADMICNDDDKTPLMLKPHEQDIQRLKFSIDDEMTYDWFFYSGFNSIKNFPNIKEVHVAVDIKATGFRICNMADILEHCWYGHADIVKFLDVGSGFMMNAHQIHATADWMTYHCFDEHSYGKADVDTFEEDIEWVLSDDRILKLSDVHATE